LKAWWGLLRGEGTWTRLKEARLRLLKAGEAVLVGAVVFERGDGGREEAGVIWWEDRRRGEAHAESGVETGVSGGVGAAEEDEERGPSVMSRSMSSSISSGSKARGMCIWGREASPSTRTMWTASKCSRRACRSVR